MFGGTVKETVTPRPQAPPSSVWEMTTEPLGPLTQMEGSPVKEPPLMQVEKVMVWPEAWAASNVTLLYPPDGMGPRSMTWCDRRPRLRPQPALFFHISRTRILIPSLRSHTFLYPRS